MAPKAEEDRARMVMKAGENIVMKVVGFGGGINERMCLKSECEGRTGRGEMKITSRRSLMWMEKVEKQGDEIW